MIVKKINIDNEDDRSNYYNVTATVNVLCKEYIIKNNGTPEEKYKNEYTEITYLMKLIQSKEKVVETKRCPNCGTELNDNETSKCPNCGANLDINHSGKCIYCGQIYKQEDYDWVLISIISN